MTDQELMQQIKKDWGPAIVSAIKNSVFTEAFIAALSANESSGNLAAKRLEPDVLVDIVMVFLGKKPAFGTIGGEDVQKWATANTLTMSQQLEALTNLATSWGPTQIMGYHCLEAGYLLSDLANPKTHFVRTVQLLNMFNREFRINTLAVVPVQSMMLHHAEKFFRCWNTGRPDGTTADPDYVSKGITRIDVYQKLQV